MTVAFSLLPPRLRWVPESRAATPLRLGVVQCSICLPQQAIQVQPCSGARATETEPDIDLDLSHLNRSADRLDRRLAAGSAVRIHLGTDIENGELIVS